jgi:phosphatidate cytidylyltransferase
MAEQDDHTTQPPRPSGEGIRIIGAEEAASALETGAAEGRRPADVPRYGDVPSPPPPSSRPPALRFPLADEEDERTYGDTEGVAGTRVEPPAGSRPLIAGSGGPPEMPHWTEPPTGEVPRILPDQAPPDEHAWSSFTKAPRWRDAGEDWDEAEFGDASTLADDETRLGALDTTRSEVSDLYSFDDPEPPPTRIRTRAVADDDPCAWRRGHRGRGGARPGVPAGARRASGRDNTQAVIIGLALGAVYLIFSSLGPRFLVVLAAAVVVILTAEVFAVLRRAGYKPATLLGLVATLALILGCYWKGERAVPLVVVLAVIFTFLWYLAGVVHARPTVNIAATLLAFGWGGLLGSFAALLLRPSGVVGHDRDGVAFLMAAVLCTVVNDVIAYVAGQAFGRTPLAPNVSPHKTVEGFGVALVVTALTGAGIVGSIHPFTHSNGLLIGLAIAIVAPLGDLCESMVKRDIGLKDMGAALPGHGGLADRFDGLLFALPTTYYLLQVLHVGVM